MVPGELYSFCVNTKTSYDRASSCCSHAFDLYMGTCHSKFANNLLSDIRAYCGMLHFQSVRSVSVLKWTLPHSTSRLLQFLNDRKTIQSSRVHQSARQGTTPMHRNWHPPISTADSNGSCCGRHLHRCPPPSFRPLFRPAHSRDAREKRQRCSGPQCLQICGRAALLPRGAARGSQQELELGAPPQLPRQRHAPAAGVDALQQRHSRRAVGSSGRLRIRHATPAAKGRRAGYGWRGKIGWQTENEIYH